MPSEIILHLFMFWFIENMCPWQSLGLFSTIRRNQVWKKNSCHLNGKLFHINSKHFLWSTLHKIRMSISLTHKVGGRNSKWKNVYKFIYLPVCLSIHHLSFSQLSVVVHASAYLSVEYWANAEFKRLWIVCPAAFIGAAEKSLTAPFACSFCDSLV